MRTIWISQYQKGQPFWTSMKREIMMWQWLQLDHTHTHARTHAHTHTFNGPLSGTTQVSRYQKGKTNLDFTEARDSEWQWHQLGHMQICTSLQTNNHASTTPLSFLQAGCPSCHPTNSVKALKELASAGPHGKYCTWQQTDNHASMSSLNSGWMLSLMPNQQCHSTDGRLA